MKKRICAFFFGILCTAALVGCGLAEEAEPEDTELPKVELVVWGAEEDAELMNQIIRSFQAEYQGQADFQISFEVQGESQCKDVLIGGGGGCIYLCGRPAKYPGGGRSAGTYQKCG